MRSTETLNKSIRHACMAVLLMLGSATHSFASDSDRITQLETENDAMRADLLLWSEKEVK